MQVDLMRLYDTSKNFIRVISDPIETSIEYDIKLDDKLLTFKVVDSELIFNEQYIRFYGQEWVIKATRRDGQYIEVTAKHNIEELVGNAFNSVKVTSLNLNDILTVIFNAANTNFPAFGWSYALSADLLTRPTILGKQRSMDVENIKFIEVIEEVLRMWFLEVEFNTLTKQVIFHYKRGTNKGVYFSSQLNLRKIDLESDTYDYVTRLIPVGKDGLRISSVNGGKNYVENYTYSNKVLAAFWVDNRYTNATTLRDDAILKLEELAMPMRVYSCDIVDLSSQNPMLSYEIGDTVTIINEQLGMKDVQRIMKMVVYPYDPEKNTADLASRKPKFEDLQNEMIDAREKVNATLLANGQISGYNVVGVNKNFLDVEQDVDGLTTTIGKVTEEINEVVTYSRGILLSNESQSFAVDADGLTALAFTPIFTRVGTYQAGNRVASSYGTIEFYTSENVPVVLPIDATITTVNPTTSADGEISIILPQGTNLVTRSGYVRIPIIIGTTTYIKRLFWSAVELGDLTTGLDGLTMVLSNDSAVIATDSEGSGGDFSQAYTDIQIFVGIINDTENWVFSAEPLGVTGAFDSLTPNRYQVTALSSAIGTVTLTATKGTTVLTKVFSLAKAYAGQTGASGVSAKLIKLDATDQMFTKPASGAITPTSIIVTGNVQNTSITTWSYATNGGSFSATLPTGVTRAGNVVTVAGASLNTSIKTLSIRASDGTVADTLTIAIVSDGVDGADGANGADGISPIMGYLTNESMTVASLADGTGYTLASAGGTLKIFEGTTDRTTASIFNIAGGVDNGTTWSKTQNGLVLTLNKTTGIYTLSGTWISDSESFTLNGVYGGVTVSKVYVITKAKAGTAGSNGTNGTPAQYVVVNGAQAFKYLAGQSTPVETSITLTASLFGGLSSYDWEYWNGSSWINLSGTQNTQTYALTHDNVAWGASTSLRIRCLSGTVFDEITVVKLYDGADGANGADAVTLILSNESHTFAGDVSNALAGSTTSTVIAYKGSTQIATTINSISGAPTGMSATASNQGTTNNFFTVNVTTALVQASGVLTVNITADGRTFTRNFSYAISFRGQTGAQGLIGPAGADGQTLYTWVKYADTPTTGMSDSPAGKTYIGLAYNKTTPTESTTYADYDWALIKGDQGIQGPAGANGQTLYTWVKYADTPTTGMADSPTGKKYLGLAYNKTSATESTNYADYSWSLIEGPQGPQGPAGTSVSSIIEYYLATTASSGVTTATSGWTTSIQTITTVNKYLWNYELTNFSDGSSVTTTPVIIGVYGDTGPTGSTGATGRSITAVTEHYLATNVATGVTRATSGWTTTMQTTTTVNRFLWNYETVTWSSAPTTTFVEPVIIGVHGETGAAGAPAKSISLSPTAQVFKVSAGGAVTPANIQIIAELQNTSVTEWTYSVDGGSFSTSLPSGVSRAGNTVTILNTTTATTISVKASDGTVSDVVTVAKVSDGATGSTGSAGADAITILLSNEAHTFIGDVSNALAGSTFFDIIAFKGSTRIATTVGTITGQVTGLTTNITNNGTTTARVTVTVTTAMVASSGTLVVPITADGKSFTKQFSYTVSYRGQTGAQGEAGESYWLQTEVAVVPVDEFGNYKFADITVVAKSSLGGSGINDYFGRFKVEEYSTVTSTWSTTYTSSINESSYIHVINPNISAIRFTLYEAGGTTVVLDTQTVPMVYDGMSNRYVSIQATSQIFESVDGGINFSPSNIYLTPVLMNATFDRWQFSYDGENFIDLPLVYPNWATAVGYLVGDIVKHNGVDYQCLRAHTSTTVAADLLVEPNPWLPSMPYVVGDLVENDGVFYRCLEAHTSRPSFVEDTTFWEIVPANWAVVADVITVSRGGYTNVLQVPSNSALFLYGGELGFNIIFRVFANYTLDGVAYSAFDTITVARTFNSTELVNVITESYSRRIDSLEKFETEVGERIYYGEAYPATNLVTNGDFSNGTTGWSAIDCVANVVDGVGVCTATSRYGGLTFTIPNHSLYRGHKLYARARFKSDNSDNFLVLLNDGTTQDVIRPSSLTDFNVGSTIRTISMSSTMLYCKIQDGRISGWTQGSIDDLIVLDLTETFGAGKEPTKEEMDAIIDRFSAKWFDGSDVLLRDEPLVTNFTNWKQEVDNFLLTVQSGGGYNLIRNSVGYRDPNNTDPKIDSVWSLSGAGTVLPISASQDSFINASASKHGFSFTGSKSIFQSIAILPGRKMSLAVKVNTQAITSGTVRAYAVIGGITHHLVNRVHNSSAPLNSTFSLNLPAGTATSCTVYLETVSVVGTAYFTDFLLAYGENITEWQQANGEIHNLNVLIDTNGVTVMGNEPNSYTNITPYEFAGYYQGNRIFTLNGAVTEVQELRIKKAVGASETALWITPFRIVQTPTSLDFVWIGDIDN